MERVLAGMGVADDDIGAYVRSIMGDRGAKRRAAVRDAVRIADERYATGTHQAVTIPQQQAVVHEGVSDIVFTKMRSGVKDPLLQERSQHGHAPDQQRDAAGEGELGSRLVALAGVPRDHRPARHGARLDGGPRGTPLPLGHVRRRRRGGARGGDPRVRLPARRRAHGLRPDARARPPRRRLRRRLPPPAPATAAPTPSASASASAAATGAPAAPSATAVSVNTLPDAQDEPQKRRRARSRRATSPPPRSEPRAPRCRPTRAPTRRSRHARSPPTRCRSSPTPASEAPPRARWGSAPAHGTCSSS